MLTVPMNQNWRFLKLPGARLEDLPEILPSEGWETVCLPHTWYQDGEAYQGLTVYEKTVSRDPSWPEAFLSFSGADQACRIFVNGCAAGGHRGGYSAFRLPIPEEAKQDASWTVRVFLTNALTEDIMPSFGDFTVFGGLIRGADLLVTGTDHFDRCFFGTDGLIVRTCVDDTGRGILTAEPHTVLTSPDAALFFRLTDESGTVVEERTAAPDQTIRFTVRHPALWNGLDDAHFYTLRASLVCGGKTEDTVSVRTGFRRVETDPEKGLLLNGRPYPLHGVARHQDRAGKFAAVSAEDIRDDFRLIREVGANAVRLSHYQHPQAAYDCCDEAGLLCWAEIPMLKMTESAALMDNAAQQLTELILQNIHHPSVFCWGIQNEIAMFRDASYMHENCRKLHALVRNLDPDRLSASANLYPLKPASKLNGITDIVGYNIYFGWYYGEIGDYGSYLDRFHAACPQVSLGISEYGVDANLSLHSETPKVKDYSEEYQALWHESVYPQIESRPWLWGSFVWNMFDFSSARRNEGGQRFINAKGLVTYDRSTRKDAFYYYKARWSKEGFVHLCGRRFVRRAKEWIDVKCYTSRPSVSLTVNGVSMGEQAVRNGTAVFRNVPLLPGQNRITAYAEPFTDSILLERTETPDPSYALPEESGGTAVRNWFLSDDDCRKEGFFSIQDTADELLSDPQARQVLTKYIPALVRVMTEQSVIPLGLSLKSILNHDPDESLDVQALNRELNRIPNE